MVPGSSYSTFAFCKIPEEAAADEDSGSDSSSSDEEEAAEDQLPAATAALSVNNHSNDAPATQSDEVRIRSNHGKSGKFSQNAPISSTYSNEDTHPQ